MTPMSPVKPPSYIPSVRARRLARSLREVRERTGMTVAAAAARLGWSQGKMSHIELGRNKPSCEDVELMLDLYGVTSPDRDEMLTWAREAEHRGWWTDYIDVLNGPYIALEDAASRICEWAPHVIPGLLQTPEYAREIIRSGRPDDEEDLHRRLRARANRQLLLTREKEPPHLHAVIDEAVLRRPIGSAEIMRDQLYKLRAEAGRPNVTIQVLPFDAGTHSGLNGPLIVLEFAEVADPDVAYVEGFHGAVYLESPPRVDRCNVAFRNLCSVALDEAESAALISAAARK